MKFLFGVLLIFSFFNEPEKPKSHETYKKSIIFHKKHAESLFDKEYWGKIIIYDKKTKESKSFSLLTEIEKKVFILSFSNQLSHESLRLQSIWQEEINKFNNQEYKSKDENLTKKEDVEAYYNELLKIRKNFALKYEDFIDKMLIEFSSEITNDEKKILVRKIKEFHDSLGLINRKKE
jgi:hypothetical protein